MNGPLLCQLSRPRQELGRYVREGEALKASKCETRHKTSHLALEYEVRARGDDPPSRLAVAAQ